MFTGGSKGRTCSSGNGESLDKTAAPHFYFTIDCDWVPGSHLGLERLLELCDRSQLVPTVMTVPDQIRVGFCETTGEKDRSRETVAIAQVQQPFEPDL